MSARRPLLALLRAHAALPLDAREAAMAAAIIAFVEAHPRCAERSLAGGHLTGSAWIVDAARRRALLTHHRKLGLWLQLGGHADGGLDLREVAWREAREESGLGAGGGLRPLDTAVFDVDIHRIPARADEPEHWHYDVRFLFEAGADEPLVVNGESRELAWVPLGEIAARNPSESLARMVRKTQARFGV
jgi:8-oxo-dGTP pyrophosphatase MutT (NUDIX family)